MAVLLRYWISEEVPRAGLFRGLLGHADVQDHDLSAVTAVHGFLHIVECERYVRTEPAAGTESCGHVHGDPHAVESVRGGYEVPVVLAEIPLLAGAETAVHQDIDVGETEWERLGRDTAFVEISFDNRRFDLIDRVDEEQTYVLSLHLAGGGESVASVVAVSADDAESLTMVVLDEIIGDGLPRIAHEGLHGDA